MGPLAGVRQLTHQQALGMRSTSMKMQNIGETPAPLMPRPGNDAHAVLAVSLGGPWAVRSPSSLASSTGQSCVGTCWSRRIAGESMALLASKPPGWRRLGSTAGRIQPESCRWRALTRPAHHSHGSFTQMKTVRPKPHLPVVALDRPVRRRHRPDTKLPTFATSPLGTYLQRLRWLFGDG